MFNQKSKYLFSLGLTVLFVSFAANYSFAACFNGATPIGYWQLEEATATPNTFDDISSTNNDGSCTGNCPVSATGAVNSGQTINATDDMITIPYNAVYDFAGSFAIELWMRRDTAPGNTEVMVARRDPTTSLAWWVGVTTDGYARFSLRDTDSVSRGISGNTNIADNEWHHIVAIRDGAAEENLLYVDGVLQVKTAVTYSGSFSSTAGLTIGDYDVGGGPYDFLGTVDEVAIYDTTLAADTILQHYLNGTQNAGYCTDFHAELISDSTDAALGATLFWGIYAAGNPAPGFSLGINAPSGMSIDATTGEISWTPVDTQTGSTVVFDVTASNNQGDPDTEPFSINVVDVCAADKLVGYWKLEEADADPNSFVDSSATGNNGQCNGNCPAQTTGQLNSGQNFAGVDDVIEVAANTVYDFAGGSFSVEMWIHREGVPGDNEVIVGRYNDPGVRMWIGLNDQGFAQFSLRDDSGSASTQIGGFSNITAADPSDTSWHHIVAVRDGDAGKNLLYVDGVLEASIDVTYTGSFASGAAITIGNYGSSGDYDFNGMIDEVAVYAYALSDTMVKQHANLVGHSICNIAPQIDDPGALSANEGSAFTYTFTVSDNDGDAVFTWSLANAPSGMTIDSTTGEVTWTPDNVASSGTVTVNVSDEFGGTDELNFEVAVTNVNDPPVITTSASTTATADAQYSYDADATDADAGDTLTWSLESGPSGMSIDAATGQVTWTPTASDVGTVDCAIRVSDGNGGSDTENFTIQVDPAGSNHAPDITTTAPTIATVGAEYKYDADATDADAGDTLTWSLESGPSGMGIDAATGEVTWTPTASDVGTVDCAIRVSDGNGGSDTENFQLTVSNSDDGESGGGGGGGGGCFIGTLQ